MTRGFLFGGNTSSQGHNKYLVEFKAGKMTTKGKMVHPDKRKGLVYVHQSDDSLMHFCWKDRTTGVVEDDFIIFPEDVEFKRVPQCTTGRVFVLKFKSIHRRCFYWLQEPKTDRDDEYCNKINEYLNNPPLPGSTRSGLGSSLTGTGQGTGNLQSEISNVVDEDLQNLLNNMNQHQLMQLLGGIGGISGVANLSSLLSSGRPSSQQSSSVSGLASRTTSETTRAATTTASSVVTTAPPVTTAPATPVVTTAVSTATTTTASDAAQENSSAIQLSDLQTILSGLNVPQSKEGGHPPGFNVDLSSAITAESLQPLLANQELMNRIQTLLPPTESGNPVNLSEHLKATVQSPQFQQALSMFSAALQSGQLGPLMQQFGMSSDVVAAASSGDVEAFVKALQSSENQQGGQDDASKPENKAGEKDKPETKKKEYSDEDMALD